MGLKETIGFRVRSLFRNAELESDMDEEMRSHFDQLVEDFKTEGCSDREARIQARRAFGSMDLAKEECRDTWGTRIVFDFWRDVKYGVRGLRASKGFALVSTLTIGLAIGACVTIFTALDAALFRPLPYPEPDRMVSLWEVWPRGEVGVSGGAFRDWSEHGEFYEALFMHAPVVRNLQYAGGSARLSGREVSSGFMNTLGIEPLRGRGFLPHEDEFGGNNNVVMLSEEAWLSRFGGDEGLVGRTLLLDSVPHQVIGILPAGAWTDRNEEIFVPTLLDPSRPWRYERESHWGRVWARLKADVGPAHVVNELASIRDRLVSEYPAYKREWTFAAHPLQEKLAEGPLPVLLILVGAVVSVLLIACANVANLLLAKGAYRRREMALRAALEASRDRIARQALAESLILSLLGGLLGVILSIGGVELLQVLAVDLLPRNMTPELDGRALVAAVTLAGGAGLLFGTVPAWKMQKVELNSDLRSGGRAATGRTRSQSLLVIVEVALTLALLSCAGLFFRSLSNHMAEDPGFNPEKAVTFELNLPENLYPGSDSGWRSEKRMEFVDTVLERIKSLPNVAAVGSSSVSLLNPYYWTGSARPAERPDDIFQCVVNNYLVSGDFIEAMGGRLVRGRFLGPEDNRESASQSVVLDQRAANALFPGEDPIGKYMNSWDVQREIVGVVQDMKLSPNNQDGAAFLPQGLYPYDINITVRAESDLYSLIESVRKEIEAIDSSIPLANLRTLKDALDESYAQRRLILGLVGAFAVVAVLLACIGLYGVMAYSVSTRERELSVRLALGATSDEVIGLVIKDGARLTMIGLLIGLSAAIGLGRLLSGQLYQVKVFDPATLGMATALFCAVSLAACWLPARRTTRFDVGSTLRSD